MYYFELIFQKNWKNEIFLHYPCYTTHIRLGLHNMHMTSSYSYRYIIYPYYCANWGLSAHAFRGYVTLNIAYYITEMNDKYQLRWGLGGKCWNSSRYWLFEHIFLKIQGVMQKYVFYQEMHGPLLYIDMRTSIGYVTPLEYACSIGQATHKNYVNV